MSLRTDLTYNWSPRLFIPWHPISSRIQAYSVDRYLISYNQMYTLFDRVEVQDSEMNQQGRKAKDGGTVTPYATASCPSRGTWAWMNPLVQRRRHMQISDLPTLVLFAWLISHDWKYCWLIYCERKILFVSWKSTAYKPSEQGCHTVWGCCLVHIGCNCRDKGTNTLEL